MPLHKIRAGQSCAYTLFMTVCMARSLLETPYTHTKYTCIYTIYTPLYICAIFANLSSIDTTKRTMWTTSLKNSNNCIHTHAHTHTHIHTHMDKGRRHREQALVLHKILCTQRCTHDDELQGVHRPLLTQRVAGLGALLFM